MSAINPKQQNFIIMRADGISFDKIATELKAAKSTLIQWSKLFEDEIKELQFHSFVQIKETYAYNQRTKYETLLKQLNKIDDAILDADLSATQIKDLFTIKNNILFGIENIEKKISTDSKITLKNEFGSEEKLRLKLSEAE